MVGILQQGGHDLKLPKSALHDDPAADYLPPQVMDGSPAPRRFGPQSLDEGRAERAYKIVHKALAEDFGACPESAVPGEERAASACGRARMWAEDLVWYGPVGIGTAHKKSDFVDHFLTPFRAAFADTLLDYDVLTCEGSYCAAHLRVRGAHVGEWLGVRPKDPRHPKHVSVRMGLHFRVRDPDECGGSASGDGAGSDGAGHGGTGADLRRLDTCAVIQEGWSQIDLLSALKQMGRDVISELQEQQRKEGIRLEDNVWHNPRNAPTTLVV